MAATTIIPVHPIVELGVAQTFKQTINYVKNPAKTNGGLFVSGHECDPNTVSEDFMDSRDEYLHRTGREQGENEILVYHVRQAFLPGEIDAEAANRLGHQLAMELTGGNHSYIVCTHTDKPHLHNHIIINAVNIDCNGKLRNELHSFKRIRQIADRISEEHNLSTIENPGLSKGANQRYKKPSKRNGFTGIIDEVLSETHPKNFDEFLKQLEKRGCKIRRRGSTISVRPPGAERFFRFKSGKKGLPDGYDEESLRKKIAEMQTESQSALRDSFDSRTETINGEVHTDAEIHENILSSETDAGVLLEEDFISVTGKKSSPEADTSAAAEAAEPTAKYSHGKKINLLIDIENSIKAKDSPGYERWAKGFNLQQVAETLLFLQTNNLTDIDALTQATNQVQTDYDALQKRIDNADSRIKDVNALQRHIGAYNKNKHVYSQYLRTRRNPKFRQENEKAIATVEEAKAYFDSLGLDKLPTIKELREEYSALYQEKQSCYQARNAIRQSVFDLQSAKKNVEIFLGIGGERDGGRNKKTKLNTDR